MDFSNCDWNLTAYNYLTGSWTEGTIVSKPSLENTFFQAFYTKKLSKISQISQVPRMNFLKILRYGLDQFEFVVQKIWSRNDDLPWFIIPFDRFKNIYLIIILLFLSKYNFYCPNKSFIKEYQRNGIVLEFCTFTNEP